MITINDEIRKKWKDFNIGVLEFSIEISKNSELDDFINQLEKKIDAQFDISDVIKIPNILDARNAYKAFGKDPSRYRLAVESLYRRLSKGNNLYRINNAVDLGNVLSIYTQRSVAVLDKDNIVGNILVRLGSAADDYYGIGRGKINIENIPLYEDQKGPFGSTTSDTERTMITSNTRNILLFIISFGGKDHLEEDIQLAKELYGEFAGVSDFVSYQL